MGKWRSIGKKMEHDGPGAWVSDQLGRIEGGGKRRRNAQQPSSPQQTNEENSQTVDLTHGAFR